MNKSDLQIDKKNCDKNKLTLLPVLLLPSGEIHRSQSEMTNQNQVEGLGAVNHAHAAALMVEKQLIVPEKPFVHRNGGHDN